MGKGRDTAKALSAPSLSSSKSGFNETEQEDGVLIEFDKFTVFIRHEHDIRGKVATDIDDPHAAQQLLGHQSIEMTEEYTKQRKTDEVMPHGRKK